MSERRQILTRESLRNGDLRRSLRGLDPGMRLLSDEELAESRRALLAAHPAGEDIWLFAYGSLIWNPAFHFVERRIGTINGYHRRFCLWTHLGRGTPQCPGLVLGLERGGSCRGVAFRVTADALEEELELVWRREMVAGAYVPRWVRVRVDDRTVRAVSFVINHDHERYARYLPDDQVVEVIATAAGRLGPCADYLFNTVAHLDALGIRDRGLRALRDRVALRGVKAPVTAGGEP